MEDRAEELRSRLNKFDSEHDRWIKGMRLAIGRFLSRVGGNPVSRFIIARLTTRIAAFLLIRFKILGIGREKPKDAVDIAYEWHKLATFMKIPAEIESATSDRVILNHSECTIGLTPLKDAKVCRASMNLDKSIIKRLGGRLTVNETIAGGAPKCRHIIEKVNP